MLIVNKRKIQNKLKPFFASLILGFRPAAKRASTTDETDATDSPLAPKRCHVDSLALQACNILLWNLWESLWTQDTQQPTNMSPSQSSSSSDNNNQEANEHTVDSNNPKSHLTY